MELEQYVLLGAVIAGITELLNRLRAKDYWVATTIVCAAVVGGLFGLVDYYPNLDVVGGIAAGFGLSGALTAVGMLGNKSTPAPSKALER